MGQGRRQDAELEEAEVDDKVVAVKVAALDWAASLTLLMASRSNMATSAWASSASSAHTTIYYLFIY